MGTNGIYLLQGRERKTLTGFIFLGESEREVDKESDRDGERDYFCGILSGKPSPAVD